MQTAEDMIGSYSGPLRQNVLVIAENIISMEISLEKSRKLVESQPPFVVERVGDRNPHDVTRENKAWVGFRSLVRSHAQAVRELADILNNADGVSGDEADTLDGELDEI